MVRDGSTELLFIETVVLDTSHLVCLPCWSTNVLDGAWVIICEDILNLLERFSRGFWEEEVGVDKHGNTEDTEEDVDFPLDVLESWWDKVS